MQDVPSGNAPADRAPSAASKPRSDAASRGADFHLGPDFYLAHGLGNDYLVFRGDKPSPDSWPVTPATVRLVCDRHRGIGSDGIMAIVDRDESGLFRLRAFNPDGSEFERSGNGLRVFAASVAFSREVGAEPFEALVGGDRVGLQVLGRDETGAYDITVEMGRVHFGPEAVDLDPAALDPGGSLRAPAAGEELLLDMTPVSVGNPHCVVFGLPLDTSTLERVGPAVALHTAFRNGTNVQLAEVTGPRALRILIWERGVGPTTASGTSSCAAAAAAVRRGLVEFGEVEVTMEGGRFQVRVAPDFDVTLRGPVEEVCSGRLTQGFVQALRSYE